VTFIRQIECDRCLDIHAFNEMCEPVDMTPPPAATVELHLVADPALPKKYGSKIKALVGGRYSEARGDAAYRFVHIPIGTAAGRDLAAQLLIEFGRGKKTTVIVRGGATPAIWSQANRIDSDRFHTVVRADVMTQLEARERIDAMVEDYSANLRALVARGELKRNRICTAVVWRSGKYHPDDAEKLIKLQDQLLAIAAGEGSLWGVTVGDHWHRTLTGCADELRAVAERYVDTLQRLPIGVKAS
jgi:hypothetical protein